MINKSFKTSITLFLVGLGGSVCFLQKGVTQPIETSLDERYRSAVRDAALVESGKDFDNLIQITPDNPFLKSSWDPTKTRILVVTWKKQDNYDQYIKPRTHSPKEEENKPPIWVTIVPQVKEFCKQYLRNNPNATEADLNLRLKQYLGLNPQWTYDVFVEMWVNPKDLFRPCVNPEITDKKCNLEFDSQKPIPKVIGTTPGASIADYKLFFQNLYYASIRPQRQPFTGLGYTYDWSGPNGRVGASEFILIPGAAYTINGEPASTLKYCQP